MGRTRRQFVGAAAAVGIVGAIAARAALPPARSGPPRQSLDVFVRDPKKLESLRRGVAVMKARDPSDHKSWFFQGSIHAHSDALLRDALARDANVGQVDAKRYWNRCPHFGQSSADFLIWHRAYLHFFERTLRDAAQDPDLSLPYWNYALPADRAFPEVFGARFLDAARTVPNPLHHPNRELAFVTGRLELSRAIGEAHAALDAQNFFHEPGVPGLAGDHLAAEDTQIGLLEQRPHNDIHLAVGGVVNSTNGAMAEITTAAFDPVFWVHHANIDRMWAAWAREPSRRWGTMPPDAWWDATPWVFRDVDGSDQSFARRDCYELEAAYDVVSGTSALRLTPKPGSDRVVVTGSGPGAPPPPARRRGHRAEPPTAGAAPEAEPPPPPPTRAAPPQQQLQRQLLADAGSISFAPQAAAKRSVGQIVQAPVMVGAAPGADRDEGGTRAGETLAVPDALPVDARVMLEIGDIHFERVPSSGFGVYLDRGGVKAQQPVGLIDLFGATHGKMSGMPMKSNVQRYDVTRSVRTGRGDFTLRIEPYDLLVTKSGAQAAQRRDSVHVGSVRFVVVS